LRLGNRIIPSILFILSNCPRIPQSFDKAIPDCSLVSGAMELQELRCKSCGATIGPENFVERLAMARCGHCGTVFAVSGLPTPAGAAPPPAPRVKVPMPRGIQVEELGGLLEIRRRWFGPAFIFLAFFCVVWNGFMIVWHVMAWSMGAWFMSLFGLLHTAVGIGLAWFTLAGLLNTTTIRARRGLIEIASGPIPCGGNTTLTTDDLAQLYCKERVSHSKNGTSCAYEVLAVTKANVRKTLLKNLTEADQALFIEQELERFLGIEDRPVPGEIAR
jgi:hypothetical protein